MFVFVFVVVVVLVLVLVLVMVYVCCVWCYGVMVFGVLSIVYCVLFMASGFWVLVSALSCAFVCDMCRVRVRAVCLLCV